MKAGIIIMILLAGSLMSLIYAVVKTRWIYKQKVEDPNVKRIGGYISEGAMAFLTKEYRILIPFVVGVALLLYFANQGQLKYQALSFILGASLSALAGFAGMKVATAANSRTTQSALKGLPQALKVSFTGGSVMGMSVVGLALLGIGIILTVTTNLIGTTYNNFNDVILPLLSGFSLGASSIALFARVGGGIFTKAADVGADLVGKVEAGIPEDDHRNPATIADNVGDNVGDVAGMGADLFESYVGSIIGAMILGLTVTATEALKFKLMFLPLLLASAGAVASIIGVIFVRTKPGKSPQKALNAGIFGAAILASLFMAGICYYVIGDETFNDGSGYIHVILSAVSGVLAGVIIGLLTEFFTGTNTPPVKSIVKSCETGSATTIITGIGVGMLSSFPTVIIITAAILFSSFMAGLFGVAMAALGMLITLGIQLAVDAYGPIADNAGGLAEMAELPPEVRKITDELDAVGNTTAAIGKGFAIGSAALTAIILFSAFKESVGIDEIILTDTKVMVGILIGAVIPYLFSSMAMSAIGKAAFAMIEEVRRQFREKPGILNETQEPDYKRCVEISTSAAINKMFLPGFIAAFTPVLVGFTGGIGMLTGLLTGVTASGVVLAVFMSNAGGAWDNAKKMIENGNGKGSESHKAAVVGDTVGDPFKDTAGPSLNILIKLMAVVSLVLAPILRDYWGI
jgi:K(+)-stimulated pyrophosphate-energized sodium pump